MSISADQVDTAFLCLLGRLPESDATRNEFRAFENLESMVDAITRSQEANARNRSSPFWHYNTSIDPLKIIFSHEDAHRKAVPGRIVNFLGVIIDPSIFPPLLSGRGGEIEGPPIPANWHADIAEFAAALRAVDLANERFRVLELGCGWGCWLLNTGVAARNRGLSVELIGAEGDDGHVAFARAACRENAFFGSEARIHRGVVGPASGTALFPKQQQAGTSWGLEPIFCASDEQIDLAKERGTHDILPILTLDMLSAGRTIDLVHIDIQGGESDFIQSCVDQLSGIVAYVVVGTHSRIIEGLIIETMLSRGWKLEIERPAIFDLENGEIVLRIDGVQGWRNPALRPCRITA